MKFVYAHFIYYYVWILLLIYLQQKKHQSLNIFANISLLYSHQKDTYVFFNMKGPSYKTSSFYACMALLAVAAKAASFTASA